MAKNNVTHKVPFFGARKVAIHSLNELAVTRHALESVQEELRQVKLAYCALNTELQELRAVPLVEIQRRTDEERQRLLETQADIDKASAEGIRKTSELQSQLASLNAELEKTKQELVISEETALLQEVGIYNYRHPLSDATSYEAALHELQEQIKQYNKRRESAISSTVDWTVNGSSVQGSRMVSDTSKLMLFAFNAEADTLVSSLKPYKLDRSIERLRKVASTISKLGKTMSICITSAYLSLRIKELELTADFIERKAKEKEAAREERGRLQEERRAQAELERERQRLAKERQHYQNALVALRAKGDEEAVRRVSHQLDDVDRALSDVDYRVANIRAGYVYVISNIGAFGESMVKIGMTRRLDPMDRINELGDASVPFRFDVHALFFSKDAVTIEAEMHSRLANMRVNRINCRREFFRCTPSEVKAHLSELAGELLEFKDAPEAMEYRQGLRIAIPQSAVG
jgi:hypothetical protein